MFKYNSRHTRRIIAKKRNKVLSVLFSSSNVISEDPEDRNYDNVVLDFPVHTEYENQVSVFPAIAKDSPHLHESDKGSSEFFDELKLWAVE